LTPAEIRELLPKRMPALVRGRWIELDREHLAGIMRASRSGAHGEGQWRGLGEAMRLLAGADVAAEDTVAAAHADWAEVVAGPWLADTCKGCAVRRARANRSR